MADKNLDVQSYNYTITDVTWETCTRRSWLNGYGAEKNKEGKDYSGSGFLDNAFSADEQSAIQTANVVNDDNPNHGTEGGNDTTDKVYLLSVGEVMNPEYGFNSSRSDYAKSRRGLNTTFAKDQGAQTSTSGESARYGRWWLRPALHLNLSSDPGKAGIGKVSVLKLKQKKGTVTVSWKKTIGAKGYQICYSTSKKWKNKKQKLVTKNKAVIKNLKKKMTCYLRVRAYILEGTKKVYGAWSSVKKIKIKK